MLEFCHVLERMERYHAIIVVSCGNQRGWILLREDVVEWRILVEEVEVGGVAGAAVIGAPLVSTGELVESEHVGHRYLANHGSKEVRPLICARRYQRPTI